MLTRIDHVMICVPDLQRGIDAYTRLGFNVSPGGVHGQGTHNAIAFHEEDYLELLSVRDRDEYLAGHPGGGLLDFWGLRYIAVQSDDLVADVAQMRQRGVDVSEPVKACARRLPARRCAGRPRHLVAPPAADFLHRAPHTAARATPPGVSAGPHPNGVLRLDRVYIAVAAVAAAAETYSHVLGMPVPQVQRGAVIKADMAVFDLGPTASRWRAAEPGPRRRARPSRARPFQVLYRTRAWTPRGWMADHNYRPRVASATPANRRCSWRSCGAYIGFVGG